MKKLPLFLFALLLATVHAQARPSFLITAITYGQPGQVVVLPRAINNLGQVTGLLGLPTADNFAFFYSGGQMVQIPSVDDTTGLAINRHGVVAGGYSEGLGSFIWPGLLTPFGPLGSFARGINNSGTVVGGPPAYVYQFGVVTILGLGPESIATGINNSGQVVGNDGSGGTFLWQNGNTMPLPLISAIAINNNGHVLGVVQSSSGSPQPVLDIGGLLDLGGVTNIPLPAGTTDSVVYALNDRDHVVGIVQLNGTTIEPFLWNGRFWLLNSLIPAGSGWVLQDAEGINNKGQIVGSGTLNGIETGYILTPQ